MIVGLISVDGYTNVWTALDRGGRLALFKTDLNFETRGSVWAYLLSTNFTTLYQFSMSQSALQRYISLPTFEKAKHALWIQICLCQVILMVQFTIGATIFATYEKCDPLTAGFVEKIDQIFPYYVQEKASLFPGFNGIFIAGVFAAGLSTTSTLLNTISGTIYTDFLATKFKNASQKSVRNLLKLLVAVVGAAGIGLMFVIEKMGTIFSITHQCFTLSTVGVFGLFINGILFRTTNSKGAKFGVIVSMAIVGILIIGGLNKQPDPLLPLRTDGCDFSNTISNFSELSRSNSTGVNANETTHWIFRINFQFFAFIGLFINILVSYTVSWFTGGNTVKDQKLLATFIRKNIPQDTPLLNNN
ncbi:sodium-coupled monocarboxylate transporter 2-like [Phlebotomus papatasi]|nr:sodium-coupled monocarboxylate transporter 2-like [Phlebotomus papatasi]